MKQRGTAPLRQASLSTAADADFDYDVFVSYAHVDSPEVTPIVDALTARGLRVWFDDRAIEDFASISRSVDQGVRRSKSLLAYFSTTYPTRRACQWELTAAFLAGRARGDPRERVMVINAAAGVEHIEPVELRDARFRRAPSNDAERKELADAVASRVGRLKGALDAGGSTSIRFYGRKAVAATRFVGRIPDLWRVHSALHSGDVPMATAAHPPDVAVITGLAGVGKSLLAEEYALRFGAAHPGGVLWLRGSGSEIGELPRRPERAAALQRQLRRLCYELGLDAGELSHDEVEPALAAAIEALDDEALWVVDDLPPGLGASELRTWLSPHPLARTLLTTRSRKYGAIARPVDLGGLAREEAHELLTRRRKLAPAEDSASWKIVDDLGAHPLAIDVAAAAIVASASPTPVVDFRHGLSDLTEDELEAAAGLADVLPSGHEASITATLNRSVGLLGESGRDLLLLASQLAATAIPTALLAATYRQDPRMDQETAAAYASSGIDEARALSLLNADQHELRPVHVLVRRVIRRSADERATLLRAAAIHALVDELAPVSDAEEALAHSDWFAHARELVQPLATPAEAVLARLVAHEDMLSSRFLPAIETLRATIATLSQLEGTDHVHTLRARSDLVSVLRDSGELAEAVAEGRTAAADAERALGSDHLATINARKEFAHSLMRAGLATDAVPLLEDVVEQDTRLRGAEDRNTLRAKSALADALEALHRLNDAATLREEILETSQRHYGPTSTPALAAMNRLASLRRAQGDFAASRALFEDVMTVRRERFGENHPLTLTAKNNLGQTLRALGELEQLVPLQEEVLEQTRLRVGDEHPNTLIAMTNLALTLEEQGRYDEALQLQREVLARRRRRFGDEHLSTLITMSSVGNLERKVGKVSSGRRLVECALAHLVEQLGEDHPDALVARLNLAQAQYAAGDAEAAITVAKEVVEATRRVHGAAHPRTIDVAIGYAQMLERAERREEARGAYEAAAQDAAASLGDSHRLTRMAREGAERLR